MRTHVDASGTPWWLAKDVAAVLGYKDAESMTRRLDDDEKLTLSVVGLVRYSIFVNESGLYSSILWSQKPEAKAFKRWITREVLPTIRKTGSYSADAKSWTLARDESKASRRVETDIIAKFIEYAKNQGSQSAELYYVNFSKMVNSQLLEFEGKAPPKLRDSLNSVQLHSISVAESIIARTLVECMTAKRPYKEVYQLAKQKIETLGSVVGKSKPGITAREYVGLLA